MRRTELWAAVTLTCVLTMTAAGPAWSAQQDELQAASAGPAPGDVFVTNFGGNSVSWYEGSSGEFGGVFIPEGRGGLDKPVGIAFGADGHLYVSSAGSHQVLRYDGKTGEFRDVFAEDPLLQAPSFLQFGPAGDLFVGTFQGGRVLRFDGRTGEFLATVASGFVSPIGLRFDSEGRPYVASAGQNRIVRFDPDSGGAWIDDFVNGGGSRIPDRGALRA